MGTAQNCCLWRSRWWGKFGQSQEGQGSFSRTGCERRLLLVGASRAPCVGSGPRPSVVRGGRAKLWTWSGFTQASCLDIVKGRGCLNPKPLNHGLSPCPGLRGPQGPTRGSRQGECSPQAGAAAHPLGHCSSGRSLRVTGWQWGMQRKWQEREGRAIY